MYEMIIEINTQGYWTCDSLELSDNEYKKTFSAQDFMNARNYVINLLNGIKSTYTTTVPYDDTIAKQEIDMAFTSVVDTMLTWETPKTKSYSFSSHLCSISVAIIKIS